MRFLIDANLPRAVIAVAQSLGHQVEFARDIWSGVGDRRTNRQTCIAIWCRASYSGLGLRGYPSIPA